MRHRIKDIHFLRKILWADVLAGGLTALLAIIFLRLWSAWSGLPASFVLYVSVVTLAYATVALVLAIQRELSISLLRILVAANWVWTFISVVLLVVYFKEAYLLGRAFLFLQIGVVACLAHLEGSQLIKTEEQQLPNQT